MPLEKKARGKIGSKEFAARAIDLFDDYSEFFGLADSDFPDREPQEKQCEFESKFHALICQHLGHEIGPDQCGKPEHDFCGRCGELRVDLEAQC